MNALESSNVNFVNDEQSYDRKNLVGNSPLHESDQRIFHEFEPLEGYQSEEDLPIATPVQNHPSVTNEPIEVGRDVVIDGIVVETNKSKKKLMGCFGVVIFIILVVTAVTLMVLRWGRSSDFGNIDQSVPLSPSPTITTSPTTVFDYDSLMQQIAIQVSGEEVSKDPTTLQYKAWKAVAINMPRLIHESILQLNDTKKIAQRYTIAVVAATSSRKLLHLDPDQELKLSLPDECDLPFFACNDKGYLTALFLENQWSLESGGGMLAREIGALPELREIRITRSAIFGPIPSDIGTLMNLQILDLNDNLLTGPIPSEVGQLQNLQLLLVDQNQLDGEIPSEMGLMKSLVYMDSSRNSLSGSIPSEIALLDNLEGLNIISNPLKGSLEFFCENQTVSSENSKICIFSEYRPSYNLDPGARISCDESDRKVLCSCCICG